MILLYITGVIFTVAVILALWRTEPKNADLRNPYVDSSVNSGKVTISDDELPDEMWRYVAELRESMKPIRKHGIYERVIKRLLDIIFSFLALLVLSPLYLIVSVAVIIDDPGRVFFTQRRIGKEKKYFAMHKFRTMKKSAPHDMPTHLLDEPDKYITCVGKILRHTSLDEIPQVWDIFRGRMSIVGPRPALWNQADLIAFREVYGANDIKPGLTGWAQVNGRDELELKVKAKFDGEYAEKISFLFDIKCLIKTVFSVCKAEGVSEGKQNPGLIEGSNKETNK